MGGRGERGKEMEVMLPAQNKIQRNTEKIKQIKAGPELTRKLDERVMLLFNTCIKVMDSVGMSSSRKSWAARTWKR